MALSAEDVAQALAYERGEAPGSPFALLHEAARRLVGAAERRRAEGAPLDLDALDVLKGFALAAAAEKLGSREAAFLLFGRGTLVSNRNHHKVLRRELERVEALCRALGAEPPFPDLMKELS
jgi:hypothetical protein